MLASLVADIESEGVALGVLSDLVGYHLRRASGAFATDFARALAGTEIRQVLFGILSVVAANPGINQGAAGKVLGIQRANMVALINELVELELIERKVSRDDRRAFELKLLPAGQERLDDCLNRIRAHEEEMLADIGSEDRARLLALLGQIAAKERS